MKILPIFIMAIIAAGCTGSANSASLEAPAEAQPQSNESKAYADPADAVVLYTGTPELIGIKPSKPVVIDFNASWCGPCRMFAPVFHEVAQRYVGKATFYSVNVDQFPQLARYYGVTSIPCIIVIDENGKMRGETGYMDAPTFTSFLAPAFTK